MKEADIMLTAIIVYLIIGGIITLYLCNTLGDIVKDETLAMKVLYYAPIYISQLQAATTEAQLNLIMRTARQHS